MKKSYIFNINKLSKYLVLHTFILKLNILQGLDYINNHLKQHQ